MNEIDGPRKMAVEQSYGDYCDFELKEIEEQTCQLFEAFLRLDDILLDAPLAADNDFGPECGGREISDSPIDKNASRTRGFGLSEHQESLEDDVVSDSGPAMVGSIGGLPEQKAPAAEKPADAIMTELALHLQQAGDSFMTRYGPSEVQNIEGKLLRLVRQEAANLTYERFSLAVDDLVGRDRNVQSLAFVFTLGKRICKHTKDVLTGTKDYFQQYVSQSYSQTLKNSGGLESFVRSRGQSMTQ